jgi:zinc protease
VVVDLPGTGQAAVVVTKPAIPAPIRATIGPGRQRRAGRRLFSSRLNQEIRIKRGLSYGAGSSLTPRAAIGGFSARVQTKNESAGEVVGLIKAELTRLGAEPAAAAELAARKSVLVGNFGRDLGTSGGLADILGNLASTACR